MSIQPTNPEIEFGPRLDMDSTVFNFHTEIKLLSFILNIRKEAKLSQKQQICLINLIYDNHKVFSLHGKDISYCNCLKHIILTMMDKPVYLLHQIITRQSQV